MISETLALQLSLSYDIYSLGSVDELFPFCFANSTLISIMWMQSPCYLVTSSLLVTGLTLSSKGFLHKRFSLLVTSKDNQKKKKHWQKPHPSIITRSNKVWLNNEQLFSVFSTRENLATVHNLWQEFHTVWMITILCVCVYVWVSVGKGGLGCGFF